MAAKTLEELLREVNARVSVVSALWQQGHTLKSTQEKWLEATERLQKADDTPRFVPMGSLRIKSTARMHALLDANGAADLLFDMGGREPEAEMQALLERRLELMGRLIHK